MTTTWLRCAYSQSSASSPPADSAAQRAGTVTRACSRNSRYGPAWSARTAEEDPGAPFFNDTPKYIVSGTLQRADWQNSTLLGPYNADSIRDLKGRIDGSIYVSGSGTLVRGLLADKLVDELHLFLFPVALDAGKRLLAEGSTTKLALAGSDVYDNGVVHLAYRRAE